MAFLLNDSPEAASLGNINLERFIESVVDDTGTVIPDVVNSYFVSKLENLPVSKTIVVTALNEFRPDTLSKDLYGRDHRYWSLILLYNQFISIMDLEVGTIVKAFSLSDLETLIFTLKPLKSSNKAVTAQ